MALGRDGSAAEPTNATVLFRGIFLVAFATLLYEITLTRILSFTIWYHFAYVVISTALLGFGASGTLLAVRPQIGRQDLGRTLALCCALAGVTAAGFLGLVAAFPLHPMSILSEPGQAVLFVGYQIGASVPFFFSGLAVSLALREAAQRVDRLYFWDLVGGGVGCALAVPFMNGISPPGTAFIAAASFAGATAVFGRGGVRWVGVGLAAVMLLAAPFGSQLPFTPARSKHLAHHLDRYQMETVFTRWTALFRTDVVKDLGVGEPLTRRDEYGLSRTAPKDIQLPWGFVNHDATAGTPIFDLREGNLDFLDQHILKLPYLVANPEPEVLVIGVGGGRDIVSALRFGASKVTGLELDPVTIEVIRNELADVSRGVFSHDDVVLVAGEGRHYVKRSEDEIDLLQITGVDTLSAEFSGAYVLAENYLYTVDAFHEYLDLLKPGGVICITMGHMNSTNPRSVGRMVSVLQRVLRERGSDDPTRQLAVIDSRYLFADVIVKPDGFSKEEVERLARASEELEFAPLLLPGRESHPVFEALATKTGSERDAYLDSTRFLLHATTDDSPFFFKSYRWKSLLETQSSDVSPVHQTALGPVVLMLLLISLSLLGLLFVTGPLLVFARRGIMTGGGRQLGILLYFTALGLGFMLFEISLMQRFVLYLGYPTYSLSVTLFSLLISLGTGSYISKAWVGRERVVLPIAVLLIGVLAVFYMRLMPGIQEATLGAALGVRVVLSIAMLAPLGIVLGTFFPLGIRIANDIHEDLVPWAWGINGCASVTGTVLTVVLAMSFGFEWVWFLSLGVYAVGVAALLLTLPNPATSPPT